MASSSSSSNSAANTWAKLRQQARALEAQTEDLFTKYSSFVSANIPIKPTDEERRLEQDIQDILRKRESTLSSLQHTLNTPPLSSSASKLQLLHRHKEILSDHLKEHTRIKNNIHSSRDRASLLTNIRSDISAFHSAHGSETEYMLDERARIDRSHNVADNVLSQAYAVNESFVQQRVMLGNINRRVMVAASKIPGINNVIAKINTRKKRDSVILGLLVAVCFLMVLYFR